MIWPPLEFRSHSAYGRWTRVAVGRCLIRARVMAADVEGETSGSPARAWRFVWEPMPSRSRPPHRDAAAALRREEGAGDDHRGCCAHRVRARRLPGDRVCAGPAVPGRADIRTAMPDGHLHLRPARLVRASGA